MDEIQDPNGDGGLADGGLVLKYNTVELRDVELITGEAGGDKEGEAVAGENGLGELKDNRHNGELDRGERKLRHLTAGRGEQEVEEEERIRGGTGASRRQKQSTRWHFFLYLSAVDTSRERERLVVVKRLLVRDPTAPVYSFNFYSIFSPSFSQSILK